MEIPAKQTILDLARRAKGKRLALRLTQAGLEMRSGVSLGSIKLFERTGKISLESLVKIAIALNASEEFSGLFPIDESTKNLSIDELLEAAKPKKERKRGRIT